MVSKLAKIGNRSPNVVYGYGKRLGARTEKRLFLYCGVSSPLDRSKHFTHFAPLDTPVHSDSQVLVYTAE